MTKDASKATEKFSAVGGSTRSLEVLVGVILRGGLFFGSVLIIRFGAKKASDMLWQRNLRASAKVPGSGAAKPLLLHRRCGHHRPPVEVRRFGRFGDLQFLHNFLHTFKLTR